MISNTVNAQSKQEIFWITATYENSTTTFDKTFSEIKEAALSGKGCIVDCLGIYLSLVSMSDEVMGFYAAAVTGAIMGVELSSDNTVTMLSASFRKNGVNISASEILGGTFIGQVYANSIQQNPATSLLRNSSLVSAETAPTVNGEICWTYE